ncbi:glycoside hydrolase family 3 domain protein [Polychytrium aggregatum]|uniref:glycoside hydrolase family 3 domain protein n=1 Tax=Polychytrium aggregatum TaxID=110093 RepID=UPI0022FE08E8|nr:glycoside hydrolase family 3 domain protein [Polychytrium aggregatum]KAI9207160.1 glycoside hydrolase family 3 domain protein [Polychytrium aggregatum]
MAAPNPTLDAIEAEIGQLFCFGFHGHEPTPEILDLIRTQKLGTIILFSRNVRSVQQLQDLCHQLQQTARDANHTQPLLICLDQENGMVRRLGSTATYFPGSMALGATRSAEWVAKVSEATARELKAIGINWNLAPAIDVNNNPANPVIGVRSFGEDPHEVARLGVAFVKAHQDQKVATSIKHFPGHGDTAVDSHHGIPIIERTVDDLEEVELIPFRRAIAEANPASLMVGHIHLPNIMTEEYEDKHLPASISHDIITKLARERLGYRGMIVTDCLEMEAISETITAERGSVLALKAGADMVMVSHVLSRQIGSISAVKKALRSGELNLGRVQDAIAAVKQMKGEYTTWETALSRPSLDVISCEEHVRLSNECYRETTTLVHDRKRQLPLQLAQDDQILVLAIEIPTTLAIEVSVDPLAVAAECVRKRHQKVQAIRIPFSPESVQGTAIDSEIRQAIAASRVIVNVSGNANINPSFRIYYERYLADIADPSKILVGIGACNPYDAPVYPNVGSFINTYEFNPPALDSAVGLVFGEFSNHAVSPVTIAGYTEAKPTAAAL